MARIWRYIHPEHWKDDKSIHRIKAKRVGIRVLTHRPVLSKDPEHTPDRIRMDPFSQPSSRISRALRTGS